MSPLAELMHAARAQENLPPLQETVAAMLEMASSPEYLAARGVCLEETLATAEAWAQLQPQDLPEVHARLAEADGLREAFHEATEAALHAVLGPRHWNLRALHQDEGRVLQVPQVLLWAAYDNYGNLALCAGTHFVDADGHEHSTDAEAFGPEVRKDLREGVVMLLLEASLYPQNIGPAVHGSAAPAVAHSARAFTQGLHHLLVTLSAVLDVTVASWPGYGLDGSFEITTRLQRANAMQDDACVACGIKRSPAKRHAQEAASQLGFQGGVAAVLEAARASGSEEELAAQLQQQSGEPLCPQKLQRLAQTAVTAQMQQLCCKRHKLVRAALSRGEDGQA